MEFIPNFIKRKHGLEEVIYPHELLIPILSNTYGIMIYQEQIMQAAQIMAGYSLGQADLLRRAMGKKKLEEMVKQREIFVKGAKEKHGIEKKKAEEVFAVMEKFAAYGFNRSHSAAYSVVAYQTAYLKAHYPAEYMASVLTHNKNNIDKVTFFMDECKKQGIKVLGPDVNESNLFFDVNKEGQIRFGMGAIKGTGEAAVDAIINERDKNGAYKNIFDFAERIDLRSVNKRTFESLAMAGGFDCFTELHRRQYLYSAENESNLIEKAIKYGNMHQTEKSNAQQSLFGGSSGVDIPLPRVDACEPFSDIEKLKIEKDVVGFYISGHPLDQFKLEVDNFCTCTVDKIESYKGQEISVGGIVTKAMERYGKNGNPFGLFTIEDYEASLEMIMFGEEYLKNRHLLALGNFVYITGKVEQRRGQPDVWQLMPKRIQLLHEIRDKFAKSFVLKLPANGVDINFLESIEKISQDYPGQCNLELQIYDQEENISVSLRSKKYRINLENSLIDKINQLDMNIKYQVLS